MTKGRNGNTKRFLLLPSTYIFKRRYPAHTRAFFNKLKLKKFSFQNLFFLSVSIHTLDNEKSFFGERQIAKTIAVHIMSPVRDAYLIFQLEALC